MHYYISTDGKLLTCYDTKHVMIQRTTVEHDTKMTRLNAHVALLRNVLPGRRRLHSETPHGCPGRLRYFYVDDPPVIRRMDVVPFLEPLLPAHFDPPSFPIHETDYQAGRYPNHCRHQHHGADDVVPQEQQNFIYVDVFDNVPKSFDDILDRFLAVTLNLDVVSCC